ncbi:DUF3313 family protein [Silvimonas iriomotensis]|uniref:DUF3313 domain-containing protein n=1 Tax=Silvimonas iriomotensis TaxID=449662 RepID=A0ABQ2P5R7_9NEIS|nr:DUF3313 family protein [Silvimonas iriomotensis]GGP18923.1 hypothetical protein GCM10010970_08060 [Silvimonas iriomotensis]
MNKKWITPIVLAALVWLPSHSAQAQTSTPKSKRTAIAAWTQEGLQPVSAQGFDLVYAKPGTSLTGYHNILLSPIPASFRSGWEKRSATGSQLPNRTKDIQAIKDQLADAIRQEFTRQLTAGGYTLVDAAGEGVLTVNLAVVNLDIAAPNIPSAGRTKTYATSAGEMSLVADLRDSQTGEVLMRIYDHHTDRETFKPEKITSVDNAAAVEDAASTWAAALRQTLGQPATHNP